MVSISLLLVVVLSIIMAQLFFQRTRVTEFVALVCVVVMVLYSVLTTGLLTRGEGQYATYVGNDERVVFCERAETVVLNGWFWPGFHQTKYTSEGEECWTFFRVENDQVNELDG